MDIICSACGTSHKSSAKIEKSLEQLRPGQKIRLKCSQCGEPIALGRESLYGGAAGSSKIQPPEPPETGWLKEGMFEDEEVVSDIPQALVLMSQGEARDKVVSALAGLGYRIDTADEAEGAIKRLQFVNYTCVVLHEGSSQGDFKSNRLHQYMSAMDMGRRRYILYALIGSELKTFYDMQALANSANVVVNDVDIPYFGVILRKAIPEYEELFGPFMDELKIQGK